MADEILTNYQHIIAQFTFITGSKGVFEFAVDGELLYSKKALNRHANPGEILELFKEYVGTDVEPYPRD